MFATRRFVGPLLIGCALLAGDRLVGDARADDGAEARWYCPYTEDGLCIPNPRSYGYYPTRWRKWPGAQQAAAKHTETIATPTPAKLPTTEPAESNDADELPPPSDMQLPESAAPPLEQPEPPLEQSEPLEPRGLQQPDSPTAHEADPDLPPELRNDLPQPPDEGLEKLLPHEDSKPRRGPKSTEPQDIPEEEDPFKDDPLPEGSRRQGRNGGRTADAGKIRWRPDPRLQPATAQPAAAQPVALASASAPKPAVDNPVRTVSATQFVAVSHANPLRDRQNAPATANRLLPSPVGDDEVVQAVSWSADPPQPPAATPGARTNPLRWGH